MKAAMMEIDGPLYRETQYGISVSNSTEEMENLQMMKQQATNFASQGGKPSVIAEVIQAKNISKLKATLKAMEREEMEKMEQMQQGEQQAEQAKMAIEKEYKQIEYQFDQMLQDNEFAHKKDLEHIKGQYRLAENDFFPEETIHMSPADIEKSMQDRENMQSKERIERAKVEIQRKKVENDKKIAEKKIEADKYKADKQLEVARENKNQYDSKSTPTKSKS